MVNKLKLVFLIIFKIFLIINVHSQTNVFSEYLNNPSDQRIYDIVELNDSYILTGGIKQNAIVSSYILKISKTGNLLNEIIVDTNSFAFRIYLIDSKIVLFSTINQLNINKPVFKTTFLDSNLNILSTNFTLFPDSIYYSRFSYSIDKDSNIIIAGTSNSLNSPPSDYNIYLIKLNNNGDSLNSRFIQTEFPISNCYDLTISKNRIYLYNSLFSAIYSSGSLLKLDYSFNILDTNRIQNFLYDIYSPKRISASKTVMLSRKESNDNLFLSITDTLGNVLQSKELHNQKISYPAYQNTLAFNNENLFYAYVSGILYSNPFFGVGIPSQVVIGKADTNLNILWENTIDSPYYHFPYNIIATKDKGCLTVGTYNDTINHNNIRNIFLIKTDSAGNTTWTKNIKLPKAKINIFPNPASNYINIELKNSNSKIASLKITDSRGKLIKSIIADKKLIKIDIRNLSSGIYFINGENDKGERFFGKFVKE